VKLIDFAHLEKYLGHLRTVIANKLVSKLVLSFGERQYSQIQRDKKAIFASLERCTMLVPNHTHMKNWSSDQDKAFCDLCKAEVNVKMKILWKSW
jgi:hypothetical protein